MSLRVQGVDIFLKDSGNGPPILFLHGVPDSCVLWEGITERLQDRYRCLAPDLPGFGRSGDAGNIDCSLTGFSRLVEGMVRGIGIEEPLHLVVHDFGGPIGLAWAVEHPERVRSLTILNTAFSSSFRWHFWAKIWRAPILGELSLLTMNWPLFRWSIRLGARQLTDEQIREAYRFVTPKMKRMVLRLYRATDPENFRGWEERLRKITADVPTLVLWGDCDPYVGRQMATTFGTDNVRHFPEHGHWLPAEAPVEVAEALGRHLGAAQEIRPRV